MDPGLEFLKRLERIRCSPQWDTLPFHRRVRILRKAHQWSQSQLAGRMVQIGRRLRGRSAGAAGLKRMISMWENGDRGIDEHNRQLLALALEVTVADLGLSEDPDVIW